MDVYGSIDLKKNQLIQARVENLTSLPMFVAGQDEGRLVLVTTGIDQGLWVGAIDGTSSFQRIQVGAPIIEYSETNQSIDDGDTTQFTTSAVGGSATRAFVSLVRISSSDVTSGQVRVQIFEDSGRSKRIYDAYFDMQQSPDEDRIPVYIEIDNSTGDLYFNITNLTGSDGTFDILIKTSATVPATTPPPPGNGSGINSGVAGNGISYDGINTRLDIDLDSDSGLQLVGSPGDQKLSIDTVVSGGIVKNASGIQLDQAVALVYSVNQNEITGRKQFSQFALTPSGVTGPPSSGTHIAGEFHMDDQLDVFKCIQDGTPGTWIFVGHKRETGGGLHTSYTGTIAAGGSETVEITATGRRGIIRKLYVWGSDPARGTNEVNIPFSVICYPNENIEGREELWQVNGQVRKSYLTAGTAMGGDTLTLNDLLPTNLGDLIRIRAAAGPTEEYQRVLSRDTGASTATVQETLVNAASTNDICMFVNEYTGTLPWENNSGVGANFTKIYLRFINDGTSDVILGYQVDFDSVG